MYLKRLELYGFKTFADRTELEFGPGITAIVGPNGSGKSNISDGILWVLGEQAMKTLRSAKSTDVIFNGSDARKAHGMAEVHLTLDNSAGMLPTDYTEVTVTRRVFRSGEAEYLINRTPVRLRDVQSLFLDTGIGKQSYSIISQGEVDAVLSSNSDERRALFEEAAGINKYKHRKKEALRKLEQTRLNLLRVSDIIEELDGQLAPLAEQSEKARQFQLIHDELTVLQLSLLVAQYLGLQSSMQRSHEREEELQRELESHRHALKQCEVTETTLRAELQASEDELEERRGVEHRVANAVQAAENALELLRQQENNARKECERLRGERDDWEGQSGRFDAEIAAAHREQARLREVIAGLENDAAAADATLKEAVSAVNDTARLIQERRGAYLDAMDQVAKVRNELARVESLLRTSEGRTTRLLAEQAEVAQKLEERNAARRAAIDEHAARQAHREQLNRQRTEASRARQGMVEAQTAIRQQENRAREELAALRSRQHTLQELEESLEGYFPGVRAVMAAVSAGKLRGWYAPTSELLDVPAELETAIEVALGAGLQDVVTESEASARDAMALLKSTKAGRATFLPLELLSPAPRATVPPSADILGIAMDLVGFDPRYEKVAQYQLGRVIVARDLDAALALARENSAQGWNRIVTLEGEVIHPARAITGGSLGKGSGLLQRKRELQEMTAKVGALETNASVLQRKMQEAATDLQRLDAEIAQLARESERAATAVAEAERTIATIQRDIASLNDRQAALADELAWLGRELEDARAEERRHVEQLNALEIKQQQAEDAISEAERSLADGQTERDAVTERFSSLRLKFTEARGQLQNSEAAARRAAELRNALGERLAQHAHAEAALGQQIDELGARQREEQTELLRLRDAYARSSGELDAAKGRRTALLDAIAANLEEQKGKRDAIEECQGRLHRTNLRTTQVETELGFLEGQFFDDYRRAGGKPRHGGGPLEGAAGGRRGAGHGEPGGN